MKLIVGLGNPGEKYINNRANIGFKILEVIANNIGVEIKTKKKKSLIGKGEFDDEEIILLKPQTFSELSGESVLYIASFLKIHVPDIVVIHDDTELDIGKIVVSRGGDESSNPGIASISKSLRSPKFIRIRIGIRNPAYNDKDRDSFLKSDFEPMENLNLIEIINDAEAAIRSILIGEIDEVIEKYSL